MQNKYLFTIILTLAVIFLTYVTSQHGKGYRFLTYRAFLKVNEREFQLYEGNPDTPILKNQHGLHLYKYPARSTFMKLTSFKPTIKQFVDWRNDGMVSPVQDQLYCNASWAFAITGALESLIKIYKKQETLLSQQMMIDCTSNAGYFPGCGSFNTFHAYLNIIENSGGPVHAKQYRNFSSDFQSCQWNVENAPLAVDVVGFCKVTHDENDMVRMLHQGPLVVVINSTAMENYIGRATIDEPDEKRCATKPGTGDHVVLVVGYNTYVGKGIKRFDNRTVPYWIIKNSWGKSWGSQGYYYLARGRNLCGITNEVTFPVIGTKHPEVKTTTTRKPTPKEDYSESENEDYPKD